MTKSTFYIRAAYPDGNLMVCDKPPRLGYVVQATSAVDALKAVSAYRKKNPPRIDETEGCPRLITGPGTEDIMELHPGCLISPPV